MVRICTRGLQESEVRWVCWGWQFSLLSPGVQLVVVEKRDRFLRAAHKG